MKTRIITAVVAIAVLLPILIFSDTVALPIAMALCSFVAIYEMMACIGLKQAYFLNVPLYLCALGFPFFIRYSENIDLVRQVAVAVALIASLYFFSVLTFSHGKYKLADVAVAFLTAFYILAGFNAILILRDYEFGGKYVYLTVFLGAWITDTFAYFCGMLFGRGGKIGKGIGDPSTDEHAKINVSSAEFKVTQKDDGIEACKDVKHRKKANSNVTELEFAMGEGQNGKEIQCHDQQYGQNDLSDPIGICAVSDQKRHSRSNQIKGDGQQPCLFQPKTGNHFKNGHQGA